MSNILKICNLNNEINKTAKTFVFMLVVSIVCVSCRNNRTEIRVTHKNKDVKTELFRLTSPENGKTFKSGDTLTIDFKAVSDTVKMDSCTFAVDGKYCKTFNVGSQKIPLSEMKMGVRRLSLAIYSDGKIIATLPFALKILPSSKPARYKYRVKKEYPHDDNAYTQGLFFKDGYLYEGTGREGASSLRKVELETGKVLQKRDLNSRYFGEGICLHKGRIYQLTWRNHEGFIYDFQDFAPTGTFNYNSEGWGIASDGTNLWMSDGTHNIYKLNDNLNIVEQIEVYGDKGAVDNLNELEYIDGMIWANVYTSDKVLIINPKTGEITGEIDLSNILKKEYRTSQTDVLNGIAYDEITKKIFVTGKNWPRLFEIEIYD